jgi:hypothetical protein
MHEVRVIFSECKMCSMSEWNNCFSIAFFYHLCLTNRNISLVFVSYQILNRWKTFLEKLRVAQPINKLGSYMEPENIMYSESIQSTPHLHIVFVPSRCLSGAKELVHVWVPLLYLVMMLVLYGEKLLAPNRTIKLRTAPISSTRPLIQHMCG